MANSWSKPKSKMQNGCFTDSKIIPYTWVINMWFLGRPGIADFGGSRRPREDGNPFQGLGREAAHRLEGVSGPPAPPGPQKSTISGRPTSHVLPTPACDGQDPPTIHNARKTKHSLPLTFRLLFYFFALGCLFPDPPPHSGVLPPPRPPGLGGCRPPNSSRGAGSGVPSVA